jgi:ribonuclease HI
MSTYFLDHQETHTQYVPVYTDGSRSERGVGLAVVFPVAAIRGKMPNHASIFTAELNAIIFALEWMLEHPQMNYTIYSDSRSSLQARQNIYSQQPLVQRAHQLLRTLCLQHNCAVVLCCVPAHVGVPGNELADCEANAASEQEDLAQDQRIPHRNYYPVISAAIRNS